MKKHPNTSPVSASTMRSSTYVAGSYSEVVMPNLRSTHYSISRLYPVLADDADDSISSVASKDSRRSTTHPYWANSDESRSEPNQGQLSTQSKKTWTKHPNASEFVVKWKGVALEDLEKSLLPLAIHYKIQILLLDEHQKRRMIANEQFVERVCIQIQCRYGKPVREELLSGHVINVLSQYKPETHSDFLSASYAEKGFYTPRSSVHSVETPRKFFGGDTQTLH